MAAPAGATRRQGRAIAPPGGFIRLASCPRCASRRRRLSEVRGEIRGRCLRCDAELSLPLATERQAHLTLVGRAGRSTPGLADG